MQARCWRRHQLGDGRVTQVATAVRVRGPLDLQALRSAAHACVERHDALRTSIGVDRGRPYQRVEPAAELVVPVHDLTEAEFQEGAQALTAVPFAPGTPPLLRIHVFRFAPQDCVVVLAAHPVVADGRSLDLLLADLARGYHAVTAGRAPAPAPAPVAPPTRPAVVPPSDPAAVAYWVERLRPSAPLLLPLDRPRTRPAVTGACLPFTVPRELTAELATLVRDEQITLSTALQAAFATFLHRITGQREVAFAVPAGGRTRPGSDRVVGCLDSEVVLRIPVEPAQDSRALRRTVRETARAALAHRDVSWDAVLAALGPAREVGRHPLYDVLFTVHPAAAAVPGFAGTRVERTVADPGTATLDLAVELRAEGDVLTGHWQYRTDLFDERTVRRWMGTFTEVLLFQQDRTVAELAERRRRRTPLRLAVVAGGHRLTFEQVGRQAERTARALRERGAGPDTLVGVRLGRTAELPGAVLGVLRSGAAFVPLRGGRRDESVCVLDSPPDPAGGHAGASPRPVHPDNLACALRTAGAAAVSVTQRVLLNHLLGKATALGIGPDDRVLHRTPLSCGGVWELLLPLVTGATQVLVDPRRGHEPAYLVDLIRRHRVSVLQADPATLRRLAGHPGLAGCRSLRLICSGGDVLDADLAERLSAFAPVYVHYRPPGSIVDVSVGRYVPGSGVVGLGEPYPGTWVELLDDQLAPVPPGAVGEICLGGIAVGRGFADRPGLTAQRFVPDPAGGGARRYRTGDLGRRHADGTLEYLGRRADRDGRPVPGSRRRVPRVRGAGVVARIGAELLGVPAVGAGDDFFDLGGHSLLAGRLVARVEEVTGVALRLRDVFLLRTPAALGARIDAAEPRPVSGADAPAAADRYPLSPAQRRIWWLDRTRRAASETGAPRDTVSEHAVVAAWLSGPLSIPVLRTACAELVTRHDALRTAYRRDARGEPEALVLPPADVLTVVEDPAPGGGDAGVLRLLRHWASRPFDLERGPMLRAVLVRIGCERYALGVAVHRIACDGTSLPLLIADLAAAYEDTRGWTKRLATTRRYADFALAERRRIRTAAGRADAAYWQRALAGVSPAALPAGPAPVSADGPLVGEVTRGVDARLAARLAQSAKRHRASPYLLLLCALSVVMGRWTGRREVVVGAPLAVRPPRDFDRVIGCFFDLAALRVDLSDGPEFGVALLRVARAFHQAVEHRAVALDRMVEDAAVEQPQPRCRHPFFDVVLDYRVGEQPALHLAGMHATPIALPEPDPGFALVLHARSHPGGIDLRAVHRTSVLSGPQAQHLLDQLVAQLAGAAEQGAAHPSPVAAHLPGRSR